MTLNTTDPLNYIQSHVQLNAAQKNQLTGIRAKIVANTVTSSDILDGLWDKNNALLAWRAKMNQFDFSDKAAVALAKSLYGAAVDIQADLAAYDLSVNDLVAAIEAHTALFEPDGTEKSTIKNEGGIRKSVVYSKGELNDLLPLIDACLAHFD